MDLSGAMEMLSQLLEGQEGQENLQNVLGALTGGGEKTESANPTEGLDMDMMLKVSQAMAMMHQQKDDNHTRLLLALRPFLKPARQEKVDKAMKFLKLGGLLHIMREVQGE